MDWQWKAFAVTFGTVFLAELGDKTQIATISLAAKGYPAASVFAAAAAALLLAALLGTGVGVAFSRFLDPDIIARVSGVLLVIVGLLIFFRKI